MIVQINLNVKCQFCGNNKDSQFYVMPIENKTKDGSYFSKSRFKIVCKKCNSKQIVKCKVEKEIQ